MGRTTSAIILLAAALSACTGHPRPNMASITPLPATLLEAGDLPAADVQPARVPKLSYDTRSTRPAYCERADFADARPNADPRTRYLILSGGSLNGAFGAGFYLGLSEAHRLPPEPTVVTGVSTGSLQSTFLFLGDAHKPPIDRRYSWFGGLATTTSEPGRPALRVGRSNYEDLALAYSIRRESDILRVTPFGGVGMLVAGSKGDLTPLRNRLLDLISPLTIHDVAFEACRGRKLYVGVADVDDGQAYAIDMTRLASFAFDQQANGDKPWSMDSVRRAYVSALIASSSVPVGAQPVTLILDTGNPRRVRHLFVDGGARFGVFLADAQADRDTRGPNIDKFAVTVIVNTKMTTDPWRQNDDPIQPRKGWLISSLGLRAVDLLENQVYRLSIGAVQATGKGLGGVHLAYLNNGGLSVTGQDGAETPDSHIFQGTTCARHHDDDRDQATPVQFFPRYMACLIDYGRQRGGLGMWNIKPD